MRNNMFIRKIDIMSSNQIKGFKILRFRKSLNYMTSKCKSSKVSKLLLTILFNQQKKAFA